MKKRVYVLVVDNYLPEVCEVSLPLIEKYAEKINAEFYMISDKKFPDLPVSYEKLQIYELGKDYDWNILIDADMLIHPNMYNIFDILPEGFVGVWHQYAGSILFKNIELGIAANFLLVPKSHHEVWKPFDNPHERVKDLKNPFNLDEYCISYNMKQLGYKISGVEIGDAYGKLFYHLNVNTDNKDSEQIRRELKGWSYILKYST